jgi:hypothetical protein
MASNPGSGISFLRFEDEQGIYKIVGIGPTEERVRVRYPPEAYFVELAQAQMGPCAVCGKEQH